MPFTDADNEKRRWVSTRDTIWLQDPLRRAGETLARDVETFLFDDNDPKHRDVAFLMWAVARYDVAKTGSGRYADTIDYDPAEAMKDPFGPNPSGVETAGRISGIDVRLPDHAREAIEKESLFGDTDHQGDKEMEVPHYSRPDLPSGVTDGRSKHNLVPPPPGQVPLVNDEGDPAGLAQAPRYDGPVKDPHSDEDPLFDDAKPHDHPDHPHAPGEMPEVHADDRVGEEFSMKLPDEPHTLDDEAKPRSFDKDGDA